MRKILAMVATMMIAGAIPAAAGDYHCAGSECEPPEPQVFGVEADVKVCGDPRMWVRYENTGDIDTTVKWVFRDGNKQKGSPKVVVQRYLGAGSTIVLGSRWVLGNGAVVKVKAYDPVNEWWFAVLKFRNYWDGRWGEGDCPANRFGTPTWDDPTQSSR